MQLTEQLEKFEKWFDSQSLLIKAILLLIPGVNWVCECLIRLSVMLRTKSTEHIVVFVAFLAIGWGWFLAAADFVYMLMKGHLFLTK